MKAHTTVFEVNKNSYFGITDSDEAQVMLRLEDRDDVLTGQGRAATAPEEDAACCADREP